ncbi:MAG: SCO1664 family protein [Acidimicrobiales bacterium]
MEPTEVVLARGDLTVVGRMPWSSNATFLVECVLDGQVERAVYKPVRGERPLWDFPEGLHRRERSAYVLSDALGWDLVPTTIIRDDAPMGTGSMQHFVDADFAQHYFTILEDPATHDALRHLCAFDIVANATDRKGGHVLIDGDGGIWAIDNGLCFHAEPKLRTVIWDFAFEPIPAPIVDGLCRLGDGDLPAELRTLLSVDEVDQLELRARGLVRHGVFPHDPTGRRVPWPLV